MKKTGSAKICKITQRVSFYAGNTVFQELKAFLKTKKGTPKKLKNN